MRTYPELGDLIGEPVDRLRGTARLSEIRESALEPTSPKMRVIYLLRLASGQIVLVTIYAKNVRENIDPRLLKRLKEGFDRG